MGLSDSNIWGGSSVDQMVDSGLNWWLLRSAHVTQVNLGWVGLSDLAGLNRTDFSLAGGNKRIRAFRP